MPEQPPSHRKHFSMGYPHDELDDLARRMRTAGGKRIVMSDESALLIAHALRVYGRILEASNERDMPFSVEIWDPKHERQEEVVVRASNGIIARAAYEATCLERPTSRVLLRNGARPMAERPAPETLS